MEEFYVWVAIDDSEEEYTISAVMSGVVMLLVSKYKHIADKIEWLAAKHGKERNQVVRLKHFTSVATIKEIEFE